MEIDKELWAFLSPIIASFLTYIIVIRGKRKDVDIEKEKKLNTVISDLLDVFSYLKGLERISDLKKEDELPFPGRMISILFLKSGLFNEQCFKNLQLSVVHLKEYDPIVYAELNGIGEKYEYLKTNFILPMINSKNHQELNGNISKKYLEDILLDIKKDLFKISRKLGWRKSRLIKKKINKSLEKNIEDIKNDMTKGYLEFIKDFSPELRNMTLEEFKLHISTPEYKRMINDQLETLENVDVETLMTIIAENPHISFEELKEKLEISVPAANNG